MRSNNGEEADLSLLLFSAKNYGSINMAQFKKVNFEMDIGYPSRLGAFFIRIQALTSTF